MKQAVVIGANEVREILAEKFEVPVENVIKSQYSYTVILEKQNAQSKREEQHFKSRIHMEE